MARRAGWIRITGWGLAAALALVVLALALAFAAVRRSVPTLDGTAHLPGLHAPLTIARDALGTAVVHGDDRLDVARGLGFVHAQERFFEMDLTRRSAAGELSELVGPAALERDKGRRLHRLRERLAARVAQLPPDERTLLQAYADGVNAGLAQLPARPWQYLLLRAEPRRWEPADSLLVIAEMFWMLQGNSVDAGFARALLRERVGDARFDWLSPTGGRWDAALDGSASPAIALPGPELIDVRTTPALAPAPSEVAAAGAPALFAAAALDRRESPIGSNNWAVSGARSADGGALLADDMHLGLGVPAIWFRAQLEIGHGAGALRGAGVTLPGLPALVVGSNGAVAWGFTNAYGQWFDWIALPADASAPRLTHVIERIAVKGQADAVLDVAEFDGAPVVVRDGRSYALRWIADQGEAYDIGLDRLLAARSVDDAADIAQHAGMPHQNILLADSAGHIAWTIAGRLWAGDRGARFGRFESPDLAPATWLAVADYPLRKDPADGQLWTANARQLGGAGGALIGDGGFDLGARAQQIRDRLAATPRFDEHALGAIQFDDDARFMRTWAARIGLAAAAAGDAAHADVAALLARWNGRADADQPAYRLLRATRRRTLDALWLAWTRPLLGAMQDDEKTRLNWSPMFEYSVEQALEQRPPHLLPRPYANWDAFLLAQVAGAADEMTGNGKRPLADATWGAANASHVRHPLSRALPGLSRWLDMPSLPQSGDGNLPHVTGADFGQSERLVVAPGHEERATLVMPGGQSGHPLSPYYGAGHADWAAGRTEPLLAGAAQHTLTLAP
jgi:penicillin amidase